MLRRALLIATPLVLAACADLQNPLGEPIWSSWDNGQGPVSAYDPRASIVTPYEGTGSITPASATVPASMGYDRWTPVETDGTAPLAPLETQPLAPPPGLGGPTPLSSAGAPDPYEARHIQHTPPLAVTGLGAEQRTGTAPRTTLTTRTLPLVVTGEGLDATSSTKAR